MMVMLLAWVDSRVTEAAANEFFTEPNLAVSGDYVVVAYIRQEYGTYRVGISASSDGGFTWDFIRYVDWGNCNSVADPVAEPDPSETGRFYVTALAECGAVDTVIFCSNVYGPPDNPSSWDCWRVDEHYYENKDHPWIAAVDRGRIFLVFSAVDRQGLILLESNDFGYTWHLVRELYVLGEEPKSPYLHFNGYSLYVAAESYNGDRNILSFRVWRYKYLSFWDSTATFPSYYADLDDMTYIFCRYPYTVMRKWLYGITSSVDGAVALVYLLSENPSDPTDTCMVYVSTTANDGASWNTQIVYWPTWSEQYTPAITSSYWGRLWVMWQECNLVSGMCVTKMSTTNSYRFPSWLYPMEVSLHSYRFYPHVVGHHYNDIHYDSPTEYLYLAWGNDSSYTSGYDVWFARSTFRYEDVDEEITAKGSDGETVIYDVAGRRINASEARRGVFFIKEGRRVRKILKR